MLIHKRNSTVSLRVSGCIATVVLSLFGVPDKANGQTMVMSHDGLPLMGEEGPAIIKEVPQGRPKLFNGDDKIWTGWNLLPNGSVVKWDETTMEWNNAKEIADKKLPRMIVGRMQWTYLSELSEYLLELEDAQKKIDEARARGGGVTLNEDGQAIRVEFPILEARDYSAHPRYLFMDRTAVLNEELQPPRHIPSADDYPQFLRTEEGVKFSRLRFEYMYIRAWNECLRSTDESKGSFTPKQFPRLDSIDSHDDVELSGWSVAIIDYYKRVTVFSKHFDAQEIRLAAKAAYTADLPEVKFPDSHKREQ